MFSNDMEEKQNSKVTIPDIKPAVMAETDDWVAMSSEFRALAQLPGVDHAVVWEPKPGTVYSWGNA